MEDIDIYLLYSYFSTLRKKYGDNYLLFIYLTLGRYIDFMEVKNEKRN